MKKLKRFPARSSSRFIAGISALLGQSGPDLDNIRSLVASLSLAAKLKFIALSRIAAWPILFPRLRCTLPPRAARAFLWLSLRRELRRFLFYARGRRCGARWSGTGSQDERWELTMCLPLPRESLTCS